MNLTTNKVLFSVDMSINILYILVRCFQYSLIRISLLFFYTIYSVFHYFSYRFYPYKYSDLQTLTQLYELFISKNLFYIKLFWYNKQRLKIPYPVFRLRDFLLYSVSCFHIKTIQGSRTCICLSWRRSPAFAAWQDCLHHRLL